MSSSEANADIVAFSLARTTAGTRLRWACVPGAWGGYWGWGLAYDPCAWLASYRVPVEASSIVLGLFDPQRDSIVFVGFVHGLEGTGARRDRLLAIAVERIFARYPARLAPDAGTGDAGPDPGDAGADAAADLDAGA